MSLRNWCKASWSPIKLLQEIHSTIELISKVKKTVIYSIQG